MIVDDQATVIAFIKDDEATGIGGQMEIIETHISIVFLIGSRAFKMKRAVKLPYVDYSTAELRLAACEKEVALNSKTAPDIYLGARKIVRAPDGSLSFNGKGELVDAVVEMVRFDQSDILDACAVEGTLTSQLMSEVAEMASVFHQQAPISHAVGGAANIAGVLDINRAGFATSHVFGQQEVQILDEMFRSALQKHSDLIDQRERQGFVRLCHGDLHLRNIFIDDGVPRLFDCIEFNDSIATIDILYDLSFLLMDLWHRGLDNLANVTANRYFDAMGTDDGYSLLPFFMAVRAAVRAHVIATLVEEGVEDADERAAEARLYFELAAQLLNDKRPCMVVIGGLSGSGKTTIAEALAAKIGLPPGARIIESDRTRKAMYGVTAKTRLAQEAYQPDVSEKVYAQLVQRAHLALGEGSTVIVDAVFDNPEYRQHIQHVPHNLGVPLTCIWLTADNATLFKRVKSRTKGPSDATEAVLSKQISKNLPAPQDWTKLDAEQQPDKIVQKILQLTRTETQHGS